VYVGELWVAVSGRSQPVLLDISLARSSLNGGIPTNAAVDVVALVPAERSSTTTSGALWFDGGRDAASRMLVDTRPVPELVQR
jgi:hypothetical protein